MRQTISLLRDRKESLERKVMDYETHIKELQEMAANEKEAIEDIDNALEILESAEHDYNNDNFSTADFDQDDLPLISHIESDGGSNE